MTCRSKIITIIFIIIFNEHLIYKLQKITWNSLQSAENCTKILFVADPQILGNKNELLIARIDSDRHIKKNFREVFNFFHPNLVIFLGDLMDEGSIASDRQFLDYYQRFLDIFNPSSDEIQAIYIAGDNDIGGEGYEKVEINNVKRFEAVFGNETHWCYENLNFFHVNRIEKKNPVVIDVENGSINIIISHYPVLHFQDKISREAIDKIHPKIIFSAHNHKSAVFTNNPSDSYYPKVKNLSSKIKINLKSSDLKEIQVPAANYRMGTLTIGYGTAVVCGDELEYTPIFVISRFYQFGIYGGILLLYLMILCVGNVMRCCWRRRRKYRRLVSES